MPIKDRKTALVAFTFPEEKSAELLQACRDADTTLQGALVAAANFALAVVAQNPYLKTVSGPHIRFSSTLSTDVNFRHFLAFQTCQIPMSLRKVGRHVPEPSFGLFVCGCSVDRELSPSSRFWDLAVYTKTVMKDSLIDSYHTIGMIWYAPDLRDIRKKRSAPYKNQRLSSLEVSNLGKVALEPAYTNSRGHKVTLKGCQFFQAVHFEGPLATLSVASLGKRISVSLNFPLPLLNEQQGALFRDIFLLSLTHSIANKDLQLRELF